MEDSLTLQFDSVREKLVERLKEVEQEASEIRLRLNGEVSSGKPEPKRRGPRKSGQTASVLEALSLAKKPMTPKEIAEESGIEVKKVSQILFGQQKKGTIKQHGERGLYTYSAK